MTLFYLLFGNADRRECSSLPLQPVIHRPCHYNSATGHSNCMHSSIMLRSSCQTKVSLRIPSMIQLHWFLWQVLLLYASQTRLIINLWGTYLGTWEKQFITIYRNPPSFDSHLLSSPNVIQDTYRCIKTQKNSWKLSCSLCCQWVETYVRALGRLLSIYRIAVDTNQGPK